MFAFITDILRKIRDVRLRRRGEWTKGANRRSVLILAAILIPLALVYAFFMRPPDPFPREEIITIADGASLSAVAEQLEEQRIVRSGLVLRVLVTIFHGDRSVVAGDYQFKDTPNVFSVTDKITKGVFGLVPVRIRIVEGSSVLEMSTVLTKQLPRFNKERFLEQAASLEGYLFPDTYFFLPNATEDQVIKTMLSNFELQIAKVHDDIVASKHTLHEVITMASILEKEARIFEDRRKIAGVLWRRIDKGMALQVDAVFLYILGRTTFDLTLRDLQVDSPYNTYRYKGLPPGPIVAPGLSAIRAAITPIDTGAVFYLADNNGVTHYSKTYEEHLRKKRLYLGT